MDKYKSVLNNVVFLYLDATNKSQMNDENINVYGIKIKDSIVDRYKILINPFKQEEMENKNYKNKLKNEFENFIEDYPLIVDNGDYGKIFLQSFVPELKNEILDMMELAAILEPWRKSYVLKDLIEDITTIETSQCETPWDSNIEMIKVINSLLCRQWQREDELAIKKMLHISIRDIFGDKKQWNWNKFLLRPLMFNFEDYPYVLFKEKTIKSKHIFNNSIRYTDYEKLLRNVELWNDNGDFHYQYRRSQELISGKIRQNFLNSGRILIEAPTGCGKTFAYLLIAATITYINKQNKYEDNTNFVISTDTKELQNQLIEKDIPNILRNLGLTKKIKYGAIKGKANYLCTERLDKYKEFENHKKGLLTYLFLKQLSQNGEFGDLENINYWAFTHFNIEVFKDSINCESDNCNLDKCNRSCYLKNRYNELPKDNITVVNHSLLASWPYAEKRKIDHIIIDEAHNLMEKSYDFFTEEFNSLEFLELIKEIDDKNPSILFFLNRLNGFYNYREQIDRSLIKEKARDIELNIYNLLNEFFRMGLHNEEYNFTEEFFNGEEKNKKALDSMQNPISNLKYSIFSLYKVIDTYIRNIVYEDEKDSSNEYRMLVNYTAKLRGAYEIIDKFLEFTKDYAKILEIHSEFKFFSLKNTPLNIGTLINEKILSGVKSTVFISATLRINNHFDNIKKIMSQESAESLKIEPIFDLKNRTKIFSVKGIGSYKERETYISNSAKFIFDFAKKNRGHLLVLFSNNIRRTLVEERLRKLTMGTKLEIHTSKKAIPYLKDGSREIILLGTKGFFEGIDIPGDALNSVIIDKIPNVNPKEPLYKALKAYRGTFYKEYNYPKVCIRMKQGYGRLIRSIYDYGYFIILDGGTNENTINLLERDLDGPKIQYKWPKEILTSVEYDYNKWKRN